MRHHQLAVYNDGSSKNLLKLMVNDRRKLDPVLVMAGRDDCGSQMYELWITR